MTTDDERLARARRLAPEADRQAAVTLKLGGVTFGLPVNQKRRAVHFETVDFDAATDAEVLQRVREAWA